MIKTKRKRTRIRANRNGQWLEMAAVAALLGGAAAGCADHVQSQVLSCPCDQGICCSSGVCAADENSCTQATAALSMQASGQWTGYVENFMFPSGSDQLKLTFQVASDSSLTGQVVLGTGTPPAPATDGSVAWPANYFSSTRTVDGGLFRTVSLMEGFSYQAMQSEWTARRLSFTVAFGEPWGPWCRLQTAMDYGQGWACAPGGGTIQDGQCIVDTAQGSVPLDCGVVNLCVPQLGFCSCTAAGCDGARTTSMSFDIALRSDDADGSIALGGQTHNIRLVRAAN
jgi:hypothetical protein